MAHGLGSEEFANNKLNKVGHGTAVLPSKRRERNYDVNSAENGLNNHQLWQIDLVHIATNKCVAFKAFVTEFSDSFTSTWNSTEVYGRMDPMQVFQGTTRKITLSWVVPSIDEYEAEKNLHKFEHLSSMLYPTYTRNGSINTMTASPLLRLKFTNLVTDTTSAGSSSPKAVDAGLLGTVDGFTMSPNIDMGFFAPKPGLLLPKEYSISCNFQVLHMHALGWDDANAHWMAPAPSDKFPYGLHRLTGQHSICGAGRYKGPPAGKTKSRTRKDIAKVQAASALANADIGWGPGGFTEADIEIEDETGWDPATRTMRLPPMNIQAD